MRRAVLPACLLLAACGNHAAPDADATKSTAPTLASPATGHHELRDAIQAPIDKAKAVDAVQQQGVEDEKKAVDDAGG